MRDHSLVSLGLLQSPQLWVVALSHSCEYVTGSGLVTEVFVLSHASISGSEDAPGGEWEGFLCSLKG